METITQLIALAKAHAWQTLLLHGLLALLLLATARRSQIDAWAESKPKIAGALKILRGLGIDPFLVIQGLSLLIRGRLPANKDDTKKPPSGGAGGLVGLALCAFALAIACSSPPAPKLPSSLPPDDPCNLQQIVEFAVKCAANCRLNSADEPNPCLDACEASVDERCGE
jgi:hypothetical protein